MGYIQEQMFWKRFDLADNKLDGIHRGNMNDTLYASRTIGRVDREGTFFFAGNCVG
jgi:hypothetical protein